jgi:hypothetical protein
MIHPQVLHPSAESTRRDRKKGVLVNTLTCVYTRTFIKEGEEELRNSTDIGSFSSPEGCCSSKWKNKKWVTKNI